MVQISGKIDKASDLTTPRKFLTILGCAVALGGVLLLGLSTLQMATGRLRRSTVTLQAKDFNPNGGFAYAVPVKSLGKLRDRLDDPHSALLENGVPLPLETRQHGSIADEGMGRFALGTKTIWFSSSDNSDPRSNGKHYSVVLPLPMPDWVLTIGWLALFFGILIKTCAADLPWKGKPLNSTREASFTLCVLLAAVVMASWCCVALTLDGGIYFYGTLEHGGTSSYGALSALHPDQSVWRLLSVITYRPINILSSAPVGWLSHRIDSPVALAQWYTFGCFLPTLLSAGAVLFLLQGRHATLRWWALAGILLIPLPGIMCPVSEAIPAIQFTWVLIAVLWAGPQRRHLWIASMAAVLLFSCHPLSTVLFGLVSFLAFWSAQKAGGQQRRTLAIFGFWMLAGAVGRLVYSLSVMTDYEREALTQSGRQTGSLWHELKCVLLYAPWLVLPIVFAMAIQQCLRRRDRAGKQGNGLVKLNLQWCLLAAAVIPMLHPVLWSECLKYRKLGTPVTLFFVLLAHWNALLEGYGVTQTGAPTETRFGGNSPVWLAVVFFANLSTGALSWKSLTARLVTAMNDHSEVGVRQVDMPFLKHTALDCWHVTFSALALQSKMPAHVYLPDKIVLDKGRVFIINSPSPLADFHTGWFDTSLIDQQGAPRE